MDLNGHQLFLVAGHKTITMAARYSHLSPAHKLSVVERIVRTGTKQAPAKTA
jgi:hypothetical protein